MKKNKKILKSYEVKFYERKKRNPQDSLDKLGYEPLPENPSADEYVKYLGW